MIRVSRRNATEQDLVALAAGRGTPWRNIVRVALPLSLLLALAVAALSRSPLAGIAIGAALLLASSWSNLAFERRLQRLRSCPDDAIESIEVQALEVFDLEPQGSHGPALAFVTGEGECLLLVGQWLLEQPGLTSLHVRVDCLAGDGEPIAAQALAPARRPIASAAGLKPEHRTRPVQVFPATAATLAEDLDRALSPSR